MYTDGLSECEILESGKVILDFDDYGDEISYDENEVRSPVRVSPVDAW